MTKKVPPESYVSQEAASSTRHLDLTKIRRTSFPELKPSSATIDYH
jgi:hypothetical protein